MNHRRLLIADRFCSGPVTGNSEIEIQTVAGGTTKHECVEARNNDAERGAAGNCEL